MSCLFCHGRGTYDDLADPFGVQVVTCPCSKPMREFFKWVAHEWAFHGITVEVDGFEQADGTLLASTVRVSGPKELAGAVLSVNEGLVRVTVGATPVRQDFPVVTQVRRIELSFQGASEVVWSGGPDRRPTAWDLVLGDEP